MYEPEVNDYVQWQTELGQIHEGWVYFKAEPTAPKSGWVTPQRYITIEVGVLSLIHISEPTRPY